MNIFDQEELSVKQVNIFDQKELSVKQVNIFDQEELSPLFKETDAVISTLGFTYKPKPVTGYSRFAEASSKALRKVDCKRLIVMHSWFTKEGKYIFLLS